MIFLFSITLFMIIVFINICMFRGNREGIRATQGACEKRFFYGKLERAVKKS